MAPSTATPDVFTVPTTFPAFKVIVIALLAPTDVVLPHKPEMTESTVLDSLALLVPTKHSVRVPVIPPPGKESIRYLLLGAKIRATLPKVSNP